MSLVVTISSGVWFQNLCWRTIALNRPRYFRVDFRRLSPPDSTSYTGAEVYAPKIIEQIILGLYSTEFRNCWSHQVGKAPPTFVATFPL